MNKDKFYTISSKERVKIVNELLKKDDADLQKVADIIGINYSTFTKLMQEDDYVFIKRDNQYFKFVRDENQIIEHPNDDHTIPELNFIRENFMNIKNLIDRHKNNDDFILDKRIFRSSSKIATKNFRMADDLYKQFVNTCEEQFPHLKIQDIIAQLLLNFIDQYSNK
ncbi:hypothetical protein H0A35_04760 [Bacillus licheniformis]|uniref:hypothetical protein n=1 Tax=Bacillus licheniformis TaxID=1402 RepID=UPI0011A705CF|nr:hypothetical protein [Bacillus licheniformis]MBA1160326.1 hypothetical protein [Bacillus licheniformis]